jgi:hypothetical protein
VKRIIFVLSILLLGAGIAFSAVHSPADITVQNLSMKITENLSAQYIRVSFKADIYNAGEPGYVYISVYGVDKEGFEIESNSLTGSCVNVGNTSLTNNVLIKIDVYNRVAEWRIKDIRKSACR